jgi:putative transcriptional regulator
MRTQILAIRWRLREIMARGKMTNRELATKIGMHENSVSKLKTQDTLPRIGGETLNDICKALNCTPFDLIEYSPDEN